MVNQSPWDEKRTETLKRMVAAGWSAQLIANALGDTTRNAVIGKVRRMKLVLKNLQVVQRKAADAPPTPKPSQTAVKADRFVLRSEATPTAPIPQNAPAPIQKPANDHLVLAPKGRAISIFDLQSHHCRWPFEKILNGPIVYCGHNRCEPHPYCAGHARIAYRAFNSQRK